MSDQQPPANTQDSAAVAGPTEAPGAAQEQAEVDWQKRYVDTQSEYSRSRQELKELEQKQQWYDLLVTSEDPDTRRQAAEALGYELPEEEDVEEFEPAEYDDPIEQLSARQQAIEEQFNQSREEQQMAQEAALARALTDERLAQLEGLAPEDQDLVLAYAINALPPVREPGVPVPLPDVQGAFEYFQARETERQKAWGKSKRAPYVMPGGRAATEAPVLGPNATHEERVAHAARKLQEMEDSV
jgi:hypothetical protein